MSIKNVIKQPGPVNAGLVPVGAGLVPVQSGQGRPVPVCAGRCRLVPLSVPEVPDADRCRLVPVPLTDRKKHCEVDI
jgi:hypothetical protein